MKRDMDLVRSVLIGIEEGAFDCSSAAASDLGRSEDEVFYHMQLLVEAKLIAGEDCSSSSGTSYDFCRLTWDGHEFLDAAREDRRWNRAKEIAGQAGVMTLTAMKDILVQLGATAVKQAMGLTP